MLKTFCNQTQRTFLSKVFLLIKSSLLTNNTTGVVKLYKNLFCESFLYNNFFLPLRKARRLLSRSQLRRACRQPCEQISLRRVPQGPAQVPVLAPPHPSLRMRGPIVIHDWPSPASLPQPVLSVSHLLPKSALHRPQTSKKLLVLLWILVHSLSFLVNKAFSLFVSTEYSSLISILLPGSIPGIASAGLW